MKNNSGMSLLECLLSVTAFIIIILSIGIGYSGSIKLNMRLNSQKNLEEELARASGILLQVGRVAQTCFRIDGVNVWLECNVDQNHPPTADTNDDTAFRFGLVDGKFTWLKLNNEQFTTQLIFDSLTSFEICDEARMHSQSAPCLIPQAVLSAQNTSHYFRFELSGIAKSNSKKTIRSAFTLRRYNPAGLVYQWGLLDE